jgi:hypothetical protein
MARRTRKKRKITAWNRTFGSVAKACFREGPTSGKELGRCMKAALPSRAGRKRKKR